MHEVLSRLLSFFNLKTGNKFLKLFLIMNIMKKIFVQRYFNKLTHITYMQMY